VKTVTIAVLAMVAALSGPATAYAAPSGVGSAAVVVDQLRADGFDVRVFQLGDGPLDRCTVDSVQPAHSAIVPVGASAGPILGTGHPAVYLTAKC
jgi:hypothetical protein